LPPNETFDGKSLVPLLSVPTVPVSWKDAAFSQYARRVVNESCAWKGNGILTVDRHTFTHMGYTVRTAGWRYTEWVRWNGTALLPIWSQVVARELYDHNNDPAEVATFDLGENENIAGNSSYSGLMDELSQRLRQQFDEATLSHF
jgi:hypothetical protein